MEQPVDFSNSVAMKRVAGEMYELIVQLYPICRSITGDGFRRTLEIIGKHIPITMQEIPTGTEVFDWVIPREWNIRDAYVKNSQNEKVIDFRNSNLHILNYSIPINKKLPLSELKEHLFTIPDYPEWIPYRTTYYQENWGFCLSHNEYLKLEEGEYQVVIDSTLEDGHLTYGELYLPGDEPSEVLLSCHACHPSLCNDNLSGVSLLTFVAKTLSKLSHRYTYRFLFIPGTIGAIAWLFLNQERVHNIKHGLVVTGVGDPGPIAYKRSRRSNAEIDRVAAQVLKKVGGNHRIIDFSPYGYDERQYCSPGFDLPVGRFSRSPYGEYPEYHTSGDNLSFIRAEYLQDSLSALLEMLFVLENNRIYVSRNPKCEANLGKRGLYSSFGPEQLAMLWVMNLSDDRHDLLHIAERSELDFRDILQAAHRLREKDLLECVSADCTTVYDSIRFED